MNDTSIPHIDCNVSTVADQIARLCISIRYFCAGILLFIRSSRKTYSEVCIYTLCKS